MSELRIPMTDNDEERTLKTKRTECAMDCFTRAVVSILNRHTAEFEIAIQQCIRKYCLENRWGYYIEQKPVSPRTNATYLSVEDIGSQDAVQAAEVDRNPVPEIAEDWMIMRWHEYIARVEKRKAYVREQHDSLFERLLENTYLHPVRTCEGLTPHVRLFLVDPALPVLLKQDLDLREPFRQALEPSYIPKNVDINDVIDDVNARESPNGWDVYIAMNCSRRVSAEDIAEWVHCEFSGEYRHRVNYLTESRKHDALFISNKGVVTAWRNGVLLDQEGVDIADMLIERMMRNG